MESFNHYLLAGEGTWSFLSAGRQYVCVLVQRPLETVMVQISLGELKFGLLGV